MAAELVADCPRCGVARMTFDVTAAHVVREDHNWQKTLESYCICRQCGKASIFVIQQQEYNDGTLIRDHGIGGFRDSLNNHFRVVRFISIRDRAQNTPPAHLPDKIHAAYEEAATCLSVECFNAAGAMFRLCIDFASKERLPEADNDGLNSRIRRSLGLRLEWLFAHNLLPRDLEALSDCVKDDGNDGAHDGTLTKEDAEDLLDFSHELLERLYTEPKRLELAQARRTERRGGNNA